MNIDAVLFDLDGLLVDSEPLWDAAKRRTFSPLGIELTTEMQSETTGMRQLDMVAHWYRKQPWIGPSVDSVARTVIDEMRSVIGDDGVVLMEGVRDAVEFCRGKGFGMAVVSSSPFPVIVAVLEETGLRGLMPAVFSAEDDSYGKPHPSVYLRAASDLGVEPSSCVVVEDSVHGVISGKAAQMSVIAVPALADVFNPGFGVADHIIDSLNDLPAALEACRST